MKYSDVAQRAEVLQAHRRHKMARSAHAYVRGATVKFYEWLEESNGHRIPEGPPIWICGDCHVGNLGPVADARGKVSIQIRDLDQTVIGNPAHDLIRLGLSLATAARGSNLPGVTTAHIVEHMMDGYEGALGGSPAIEADAAHEPEWNDAPAPVVAVLRTALQRRWKQLAQERLEDVRPTIPLGRRFWPLSKEEKAAIAVLGDLVALRGLVTRLHSRRKDINLKVLDAAYWVKGCSSLGRLRYAVLLGLKGGHKNESCLIDIKEAVHATAPRTAGLTENMPADSAERVVMGARALAPALGERMIAAVFLDKPVVIRELLPQDLKVEIEQLTRTQARKAARYLAHVVGLAHGRQLTPAQRASWRHTLRQQRSAALDAPHWLWNSVVDLVGAHEKAYLDHCRTFALSPAQVSARTPSPGSI